MVNPRPELDRFRVIRYDPIMPEGWNALRAAILGLYDDVKALAVPALVHRLIVRPESALRGYTAEGVLNDLLLQTPLDIGELE